LTYNEEELKAQKLFTHWNEEVAGINQLVRDEMKEAKENLRPGQRHREHIPNPNRFEKKRNPDHKGAIAWYQYKMHVLVHLLYPFYDKMRKSHKWQERGKIILMEDGAGPHRTKSLNSFRRERGVNKTRWLPCKFYPTPAHTKPITHYRNLLSLTLDIASPDFNPIERVWDVIRRRICKQRPFPTPKDTTIKA
jgi:transposase